MAAGKTKPAAIFRACVYTPHYTPRHTPKYYFTQ